jgi:hypothetical protein
VLTRLGAEGLEALMDNHCHPLGKRVVAQTLAEQLPALTASTCGQ